MGESIIQSEIIFPDFIQTIIDPDISEISEIFERYRDKVISVVINSQRYLMLGLGINEFIENDDSYIIKSNSYIYLCLDFPDPALFKYSDENVSNEEDLGNYSLTIKKNSGTVIRITKASSRDEWIYSTHGIDKHLNYNLNSGLKYIEASGLFNLYDFKF